MKRRLLIIAIVLLGGAVVNVAVAWVITAFSTYLGWSQTATIVDNVEWPHSVPSHWPERATTIQPEALGWRVHRYQAATDEERDGEFWRTEEFLLDIVHVGWPCYVLQSEMWYDRVVNDAAGVGDHFRFDGQPPQTPWRRGISLPSARFGFGLQSWKTLPVRPIWPGFAVNTLFYAAVLWLLIAGPFVLHRFIRVRRGLCPACGYDLRHGEHDACPECGRLLSAR